jgi:hypothetical protein
MPTASLESRSVKPSPTPFANRNRPSNEFEQFSKDEIKEAK